jgi:hypothetical protein
VGDTTIVLIPFYSMGGESVENGVDAGGVAVEGVIVWGVDEGERGVRGSKVVKVEGGGVVGIGVVGGLGEVTTGAGVGEGVGGVGGVAVGGVGVGDCGG